MDQEHALEQASESEAAKPETVSEEVFWEGPEREFSEKPAEWYWMLGTIAVLIIAISLILKDFLLAVIILIGSFIMGSHAKRPAPYLHYGLTEHGILHGTTLFRYDTVKSFWISPKNELIIETSRYMKPHVYIPLHGIDPEKVRSLLSPLMPETEFHGTFSDQMMEFFGF